jgi:hypothetical protein
VITHRARIVGPIAYTSSNGNAESIPLGPCLVERLDERSVAVIWGAQGQSSTAVSVQDLVEARDNGRFLLLD